MENFGRISLQKALINSPNEKDIIDSFTDLQKQDLSYSLSTNKRALTVIEYLERNGVAFQGAKVLDVGCAYGGMTIEARRRGAEISYGIDISDRLISFAEENIKDENEEIIKGCKFLVCDMTSEKAFSLPKDYFDIVIVNDVFEHVYDTYRLMSVIDNAAAQDCVLYFEIPNGLHCLDVIEKEPHYHQLGISFVAPPFWSLLGEYYDTYYRRWEYFKAAFDYFDFKIMNLLYASPEVPKKDVSSKLLKKLVDLEKTFHKKNTDGNSVVEKMINESLEKLKLEMNHDIEVMETDGLFFKYLSPVWIGLAKKTTKNNHEEQQDSKYEALNLANDLLNVQLREQTEKYEALNLANDLLNVQLREQTDRYEALSSSKLGKLQLAVWDRRNKSKLKKRRKQGEAD